MLTRLTGDATKPCGTNNLDAVIDAGDAVEVAELRFEHPLEVERASARRPCSRTSGGGRSSCRNGPPRGGGVHAPQASHPWDAPQYTASISLWTSVSS
jgi:hypothetical protein